MWDKLMKIRKIYETFGDKKYYVYLSHDLENGLEFHITDNDTFISLVLNNGGKYEVAERKDTEYPYEISTIKYGIKIYIVCNYNDLRYIEFKIL